MTNPPSQKTSAFAALAIPEMRAIFTATGCFNFASRALAVIIGFQVYSITHNPLDLGWLGLAEAIPALSLALFGGTAADHYNRRTILLITRGALVLCALTLAWGAQNNSSDSLWLLFTITFLAGVARSFAEPAASALEGQIIPRALSVNGTSWLTSIWLGAGLCGPALIGFIFEAWGSRGAYLTITGFFGASFIATTLIAPKPMSPLTKKEPLFKSFQEGWKFVFTRQPLWGAMVLDLFAVLFGGAIALLPIYAHDILHVGAGGLGILNAATSLGALTTTLAATRFSPIEKAGRNLFGAVAGFGISILIFAFSTHFWLSFSALFLSGVFDGVSMVIRRSMVRLLTPNALRGRVASVNFLFICASNELGAVESGLVAAWIGAVPCVAAGGALTLLVVGITALAAPQLRRLTFDTQTLLKQ